MTPAEFRERTLHELIARLDALVAIAADVQAFEATQDPDGPELSAAAARLIGYYSRMLALAPFSTYVPAVTDTETAPYLH
jgi:hypothetical protein